MTAGEFVSRLTKQPRVDPVFLIAALLLLVIGLAMLFSAGYAKALSEEGNSYHYISRQVIFAVVGLIAMAVVSYIPFHLYKIPAFYLTYYAVSILLLILVYILPSRDAQKRWIYIGGFQFQPSEFAKLAVIFVLAVYLSKTVEYVRKPGEKNLKFIGKYFSYGLIFPMLICGVCSALVLFETHLSGGILILSVGLIMIFARGNIKWRYLFFIGGVCLVIFAFVAFNVPYMKERIDVFLHPEAADPDAAYQIKQSLYAIGSGGIFGVGYGQSRQKYLHLPEPQNDFIFSVVSEEVGFVGVVFIVILFAILIWRGISIALHSSDRFASLVAMGITSRIAFQVIFNLAVISKLIPVTGISLPFFSYGGTALAVLLVEIGVVLQISRYSYVKNE